MPYIKQADRTQLNDFGYTPRNAGELNYKITQLINDYLTLKGESYQVYNDAIGALEGAKMELYRRKVANYENKKCADNGDVYND